MIITRKIEIHIDKSATREEAKEYRHQLYVWRDLLRKAANMIVSHKFIQQNVRDFAYMQDDIIQRFLELNPDAKDAKGNPKFFVKNILNDEPGNSEQNVTYRIASAILKGKCPSDFTTCLNQSISNTYKERIKEFLQGKASIPSYRNICIPFPGKRLDELKLQTQTYTDTSTGEEKTRQVYTLDFYHIPIQLFFGKDRSGNRLIIERALAGDYKFCGSSIMIDDDKKKMFLLACVDIPAKDNKLDKGKVLYATLGFETPILCGTNRELVTTTETGKGVVAIGNKEEYLYRRLQIQAALRRTQMACKFNTGGHGRAKKTAAIERFHEKESNYIETRLHTYSKMLIDEAIKRKCGTVCLTNFQQVDESIKKEKDKEKKTFLLRNWSYHGLTSKIEYKAKAQGIEVIVEKQKEEAVD